MPQTALFIEKDAAYVYVVRKLRFHCERDEWFNPAHRDAAIARAWSMGIDTIRSEDETFISPHPVTLIVRRADSTVLAADIRQKPTDPPRWIDPKSGHPLFAPLFPPDTVRIKTTYAHWAEGPLPHLEGEMLPAQTPLDDPEIQRLRAQNTALRSAIDDALGPENFAQTPRVYDPDSVLVDFRVRGLFRRRDYRQLQSKQVEDSLGKLLTAEGVVDLDDGKNEADLVKQPTVAPSRLAEY